MPRVYWFGRGEIMGIMGNELRVMERSIERSKWRRLKRWVAGPVGKPWVLGSLGQHDGGVLRAPQASGEGHHQVRIVGILAGRYSHSRQPVPKDLREVVEGSFS